MPEVYDKHKRRIADSKISKQGVGVNDITRDSKPLTPVSVVAVLVAAVLGVIIAGAFILFGPSGGVDYKDSLLATRTEMKEFASVEHGFKLKFPGFPAVEDKNLEINGNTIPYTMYFKNSPDGSGEYLAGVEDFTGMQIDGKRALEGGINGLVQNIEDAQLVSSSYSTFLGHESIDAHYTAPLNGRTFDGYMTLFVKEQKLYMIGTVGTSKADFDEFVGTFRFVQKM